MKVLLLIGGGRSGIDLMQSLFDQHPNISQFPGVFRWGEFFKKLNNVKDSNQILNIFFKDYNLFFNSKLNLRERHDQLGENKDEHYVIDKEKFKTFFLEMIKRRGNLDKKNILECLHLSYSLASNENIEKKKIIVINIHMLDFLSEFETFDYEILYTIRHPIASLSSGIKHWLEYDKGKHVSPWSIFFHIDRQFNALKKIISTNKKVHVIKLERLHRNSDEVLRGLCIKLNISYLDKLKISSYHGKKWWGDALSKKYLNGLNKNFSNKIDSNFFFKKDIYLLEFYLSKLFEKYDYEKTGLNNKKNTFFLNLIPLKVELNILKRELIKLNFINVFFSFYFYFKRIYLFFLSNFNNTNFPKSY